MDLDQFVRELRAEHDRLTAAYLAAQEQAEAAWAAYEDQSRALEVFRAKYGRVLRDLESGAITITVEG